MAEKNSLTKKPNEYDRMQGERMAAYRNAANQTQEDIAKESGYSLRQWIRMELGQWPKKERSREQAEYQVAKTLKISVEELRGTVNIADISEHPTSQEMEITVHETSPNSVLVFIPIMELPVQVTKMHQLLDYLTEQSIVSSWEELADTLKLQAWYITACAEGRYPLHPIIIETISHRWEIREDFWAAPESDSIEEHLGKRDPGEKGGKDVATGQTEDPYKKLEAVLHAVKGAARELERITRGRGREDGR